MARRLQDLTPFARAAAVTAAAAISISAFPGGPASAAASARPFGGNLESISCTSALRCTGVGQLDFPHISRPLVVREKNGLWGRAETIPGLSALPGGDQFATLGTVSCSSPGNCGAGGAYQESGSQDTASVEALVVSERNGEWGKPKPVPGLAAMNVFGQASVDFISCRSPGDCTASGTYQPTACQADECGRVFVVSKKNGVWGKAEPIPGLSAIDRDISQDNALTCVSPGNCAVAGAYGGFAGADASAGAFVASQKNGVWGRVKTFPAIAALATQGASMDLLSCRPGGTCTATGFYSTGSNNHIFAVTETRGSWGPATLIPGFANLPGGHVAFPADVVLSCPSAGNCTIGGTYTSTHDDVQPWVAAEKNGKWGQPQVIPGMIALNTGQIAGIDGLVCFSAGNCTAAGGYSIHTKSQLIGTIYVVAEKNGRWGKPERVPGSAALGTDVILETLSCGAAGYCGISGTYDGDGTFVATQKKGAWGKAERVPGT